jgi:serine/threonine protein kinase
MDYRQLEELFYEALELDSTRRASLLERVAAEDAELRRELETLLGHVCSRTMTHLRAANGFVPVDVEPRAHGHIDHYEIMREIGRGGMGAVFLARDTRLDRPVALKLLHVHEGADPELFLREARVTARCRHENIVVIHDVGIHHESPYMALEYLEGASLRHEMRRPRASARPLDGPSAAPFLPLARIVEIMLPVARALRCAHEQHVIHCDLKPENVFVTSSGALKVLDFGIARAIADTVKLRGGASSPGPAEDRESEVLAGTPLYMSPEQWGIAPVDARSDIWAAGLILCELATGKHPLMGMSSAELPARVTDLAQPIPGIDAMVAGLGELGELIDHCLRKRKEERLQSVEMLVEHLESLAAGELPDPGRGLPGQSRGAPARPNRDAETRPASAASPAERSTLVLEFCDLDVKQCTALERTHVTEQEYQRDCEAFDGYKQLLQTKTRQGSGGEKMAALTERLDGWIRCAPGELLFRRREREQEAVVLLLTVRNTSGEQAVLHTLEVELFERDWLARGLPVPTTRLLQPIADYELLVQTPRSSCPMIPNIAIAPADLVSFHAKLDVRFYRYSLRLRVRGSHGSRVETGAMHVW